MHNSKQDKETRNIIKFKSFEEKTLSKFQLKYLIFEIKYMIKIVNTGFNVYCKKYR